MMRMNNNQELPDCFYKTQPHLITPITKTPNHTLYLSNLDDQKFLRFSIKYLYLFKKSISTDLMKQSLSKILVDYYPLAGRLRPSTEDDQKLVVDCNGEGALFVEGFMDFGAEDFLEFSRKPNRGFRKLLYKVEGSSFFDVPPLIVQVTNLRCGGMILCTAINHCLCDGIGTSQFLHAWASLTTKSNQDLPVVPIHTRHVLKPQSSVRTTFIHPAFTKMPPDCNSQINLAQFLYSQPLVPSSIIFTPSQILDLKRQCIPSLKCTTFETLASHTWRAWAKSLDLHLQHNLNVKLLFSTNVRKSLNLSQGYYGNGFVLACAETNSKELVNANMRHGVTLVQQAKSSLSSDDYVKGIVNALEDKSVKTDLHASLLISQWSKLGLEELNFGEGKPMHMGPLTSDIYCLFLPVVGDFEAVRVLVSMPQSVVSKFEYYMRCGTYRVEENGDGC